MASTSADFAMDSSSTVATRPRWSYDAFLSFRGEDTRNTFTAHLLASLRQKGIHTFIDDEWLGRGEQIAPALLKAIEGSRIALVVFSENYASSTWCLDELSKIVECTESSGQTLIPIFYKVEPSAVRRQPPESTFYAAMENHQERFKDNPDKVQKWKDALRKASDFSGEHFDNGNEAHFVKKIAQLVSDRVGRQLLFHIAENPVGLDSEIEKVKPLLRTRELENVCFIGIVGTGGMGKTTLARAICNLYAEGYEGCSFLSNVREASEQYRGLMKLQGRLLSDLLENIDYVSDVSCGISLIRKRLENRRCLIVLDDVDKPLQIEALAGGRDWFGPGSRIIITTRDEHLLDQIGASKHLMEGLCNDHARELLSWSVFREPSPPTDYAKVFSVVLDYAKGLPLALTVLGSLLRGRDFSLWKSTIQRLKDIPNRDIFNVLKVSYDGLEEDQKAIFLYIVCFFKQERKDRVDTILEGCGYHSEIGIKVLMERSLITCQNDTMDMHDLIEEMGKKIARREKSILWIDEEIQSVLEDNTGTDIVQAIYVRTRHLPSPICLDPNAFKGMKKLRMLIVEFDYYYRGCDDNFSRGPNCLSNELRFLKWDGYPSPLLPSDFNPRCLTMLILAGSKLKKLWDGQKMAPKLTVMDLSRSGSLLEVPDVSGMPNLKELRADGCRSLVTVHESVGLLEKLKYLSFSYCIELRKLPKKLRLPSLQSLSLRWCSKLEEFPDILDRMKHVETLDLYGSSIKELSPSIENLTGLQYLILGGNQRVKALPRCICHLPNLKNLDLDGCKRLCVFMEKIKEDSRSRNALERYEDNDSPSPLSSVEVSHRLSSSFLPNLVMLNLQGSNIISLSPCISKCYNLKKLYLGGSNRLKEIPELPPSLMFLKASNCVSLETIGTESLQLTQKIKMKFWNCRKLRGIEELGSKMLSEWLKGHKERINLPEFLQFKKKNTAGDVNISRKESWECDKLRAKEESGWIRVMSIKIYGGEMISFPEEDSWDQEYHFVAVIPRGDIQDRFYHGRKSFGRNRIRFRVHSNSSVLKELAGFVLSTSFKRAFGDVCKWLVDINGQKVFAPEGESFYGSNHVWIVYIHLEKHWKEEMMLVDGWNLFSLEVQGFTSSLASNCVSIIGKSGEDLSSSTEIEFLDPKEIADEHTGEVMPDIEDAHEDTEDVKTHLNSQQETMTNDKDISLPDSCLPVNGGPSGNGDHELFSGQVCEAHTCTRDRKPFSTGRGKRISVLHHIISMLRGIRTGVQDLICISQNTPKKKPS